MSITKQMSVSTTLEKYVSLVKVFFECGLSCLVRGESFWGRIEELAAKHNVPVNNLVDKLNEQKVN